MKTVIADTASTRAVAAGNSETSKPAPRSRRLARSGRIVFRSLAEAGWRCLTSVLFHAVASAKPVSAKLVSATLVSATLLSATLTSAVAAAETVVASGTQDAVPQAQRVAALAAAAEDPHTLIEGTLAELRAFAAVAREYAEADPERYFVEIQAVLDPVLNFQRFARNVMAAPYKTATVEQRERFTETFKRGLIQTYSLALTEFDEGEVVVLQPAEDAGAAKRQRVRTEIRTPAGDAYPVVYSLALEKDNRWRIYNIVANGVNLGLTFRNQFKSAWDSNDRDLDRTIDAWASIVSEADSESESEPAASPKPASS